MENLKGKNFNVVTANAEWRATVDEDDGRWRVALFKRDFSNEEICGIIFLPKDYARTAVFQFIDKLDSSF